MAISPTAIAISTETHPSTTPLASRVAPPPPPVIPPAAPTAVAAAAAGAGALHPSITAADTARKKTIAPSSMALLVAKFIDPHRRLASAQIALFSPPSPENKIKYGRYLAGLRILFVNLEPVEGRFFPDALKHLSESSAGTVETIDLDLAALELPEGAAVPEDPVIVYKHEDHFKAIQSKVHLRAAHLAIHVLGFMFGGQNLAKHIELAGWKAPLLYNYGAEVTRLCKVIIKQLDSYIATLSPDELEEFTSEAGIAWTFACDMMGIDTRT